MTISPEALEKARAIAQSICNNTRTLIGENDIILIAAALQAERDANIALHAALESLVARIAELEAGLKDTAEALRSRLTADELNAPHHKPYEHPLSAYDRAARLLSKDRQP
jgi:hypothetical protein